jgi:LysR family transcriptional regulator for metE and metH
MELELRHLRLVAAIADAGSMTKAAAQLYLTQSALSHQLRDIEARFKTAFFLRLGKRMVLTEAGGRLLESARRVLGDLERAEDDLRRIAGDTGGTIRVCTQCNTGYHWLPPLLATFQRKHPKVNVHVLPDATDRPLTALLEGDIDLAVLTDDVEDRRLRLRPLFTDEMVAIVHPAHPWGAKTWVSPQELGGQHLLVYSSTPTESFVLRRVLAPMGITPARVSFIMLTEAMIEMARAGIGVGILPRWSAHAAIAGRTVAALSITRRGVRRQWTAATLTARPDPDYLADFIDLIAQRALPARATALARRKSA